MDTWAFSSVICVAWKMMFGANSGFQDSVGIVFTDPLCVGYTYGQLI
jgi:hypothetical protein